MAKSQQLIDLLRSYNPQWQNGDFSSIDMPEFHRRDYFHLRDQLDGEKIQGLIGPRRVGKTVLMRQLMRYLINNDIDASDTLYINLDDSYINQLTDNPINDAIKTYEEYILSGTLAERDRYIFIDEVQHRNDWAARLKSWVDRPGPLHFTVSGSSSTQITDSSGPLTGRISFTTMLPMTFADFARYHGHDLNAAARTTRRRFKELIQNEEIDGLWSALQTLYGKAPSTELQKLANTYLVEGGYPRLLHFDNEDRKNSELRDIIQLTKLDLVEQYDLREPELLDDLLTVTAAQSGHRTTYSNIANSLNTSRQTVSKYIGYLKKAYLIDTALFYSASTTKEVKKDKKVKLLDTGLRNTLLNSFAADVVETDAAGPLAETAAHTHSLRLQYYLYDGRFEDIHYWYRDDTEIDIIIGDPPIPIEVKYTTAPDYQPQLQHFSDEHDGRKGIVITKDSLRNRDDYIEIPLWLFMLIC